MKTGFLEDQLNALCEDKAFSDEGLSFVRARFYCGGYKLNLKKITDKLCPSGKVALFGKNNENAEFLTALGSYLKSIGIKPIKTSFPESVVTDVDGLCVAFNLPEDVRAVVVCDNSLFDIGAYFAQTRNIPLIAIPLEYAVNGILKSFVIVKNGKKSDTVGISVTRHILLDTAIMAEDSLRAAFAKIMGKLPSLVDYRIYGALTGAKLSRAAYEFAREAVTDAYSSRAENRFDSYTALKDFYTLEISGAAKADLFFKSSTEALKRLFNPFVADCSPEAELFAVIKIIKLYKIWADSETCILNGVDYISRAENISEILGTDENFALYKLNEQVKRLRGKSNTVKRIKNSLAAELSGMCKSVDAAERFFYAMGGKKPTPEEQAKLNMLIRLAGDEPFAFNGLSLMREEGLLEP